jgi:hypothetical protein
MSILKAFTHPDFIKEAKELIESYSILDNDAFDLGSELQAILLRQYEWEFEDEIKDHPYGIGIPKLGTYDFAQEVELELLEWLDNTYPRDDYIFMPLSAYGKYKDKWNWIYFKKASQAVHFKLIWFDYL